MKITRRGVEIVPNDPRAREIMKRVRRELVVSPVTAGDQFPKRFKAYVEAGAAIVPQFWARDALGDAFGAVPDRRAPPAKMSESVKFRGDLRRDLKQPEAVAATLESLRTVGGAVLSLPTGYGKTVTAIYVACALGVKTVVVVGKEFLADQWEDRIRAHAPGAKITRVRGDECDASGDFVIAMIQTLAKRMYSVRAPAVFDEVGFTIADESHRVGAEKLTLGLVGLATRYVLGLSATPTRKDGLTRVMHWYLGPLAFSVQRTGQANVTVKVVEYSHPRFMEPPPLNRRGDVCFATLLTVLAGLEDRTRLVAEQAKALADAGRRVLVLSHRRAHAADIKNALLAMGVDAATYLGGDKAAPDAVVTCATYALVSEGYDDARLSGLVLATPASDVVQACGRVLRGGDGDDPVIVDVADRFCVCFAQLAKRKSYYRKAGFAIDGKDPENPRDLDDGGNEECLFT